MEEGMSMQTARFVAGEIITKETQSTEKGKTEVIRDATQLFPKWSVPKYIFQILHALLNK